MTVFDDRERAYEAHFAHEAAQAFRAEARSLRRAALWAAGVMGLGEDAAADYAAQIGRGDLSEPGHAAALRRLSADLVGIADAPRIAARLAEFRAEALAEIHAEG